MENLTDKQNAWKLSYAGIIASECAPRLDDEQYEYADAVVKYYISELKKIEREELDFWCVDFSDALRTFAHKYDKGELSFPFTYDKYKADRDILATVEAYGMDVEKFWYAVLFVYWFTETKCVNVLTMGDTLKTQAGKLQEILTGTNDFTITTDDKRKLKVNDIGLIRHLRDYLGELLTRSDTDVWSINLKAEAGDLYSPSIQMWYAASRFMELFKALELPNIRAKDSAVVYEKEFKYNTAIRGGNTLVSYNKLLLASRLLYLMKYTRNDAFLDSENSLKGILKQYRDYKLHTLSPSGWF